MMKNLLTVVVLGLSALSFNVALAHGGVERQDRQAQHDGGQQLVLHLCKLLWGAAHWSRRRRQA